jgi:hypothetical protein
MRTFCRSKAVESVKGMLEVPTLWAKFLGWCKNGKFAFMLKITTVNVAYII